MIELSSLWKISCASTYSAATRINLLAASTVKEVTASTVKGGNQTGARKVT
jgi:hypothetical protein